MIWSRLVLVAGIGLASAACRELVTSNPLACPQWSLACARIVGQLTNAGDNAPSEAYVWIIVSGDSTRGRYSAGGRRVPDAMGRFSITVQRREAPDTLLVPDMALLVPDTLTLWCVAEDWYDRELRDSVEVIVEFVTPGEVPPELAVTLALERT